MPLYIDAGGRDLGKEARGQVATIAIQLAGTRALALVDER